MLNSTRPSVGKRWTDSGETHDDRGLKNRPVEEVRPVPIPPHLVAMPREHIDTFGVADDGRLFTNERGGVVGSSTYFRVWQEARALALPPAVLASPLAARRSPPARTTFGTRHCRLGLTPASTRPRLPSARATVWRFC